MLKFLVKLTAMILLIGSVNVAAKEPNPELTPALMQDLTALEGEWYRQYVAGQYDAAVATGQKKLRLTEQLFGSDAEEVASAANRLGMTYAAKSPLANSDLAHAELYHRRALVIYEKRGPQWAICTTLNLLGNVDSQRKNWDLAVNFYERALNCSETWLGPADSMTVRQVIELAEAYFQPVKRPDLVAKADLLLQRWFPIVERVHGPDAFDVGKLLRMQANIQAMHGEKEKAQSLRMRALAIAEKQPDPTKIDSDRLKFTLHVLNDLRLAHSGPINSEYLGIVLRIIAVQEKLYGTEHPYVVLSRQLLAEMRAANPDVQLPGSVSSNSQMVRRADLPAVPVKPTPTTRQTAAVKAAEGKSGSARTGSRLSAQDCEARKQSVIATSVPPNASITASQETVMFMTKTVLEMIAGGCPTEDGVTPAQIEAERQERQRQYTAAENACNAVQSGGRRCVPHNHFGPGQTAVSAGTTTASTAARVGPPLDPAFECEVDNISVIEGRSISGFKLEAYDPVTGKGYCTNAPWQSSSKKSSSSDSTCGPSGKGVCWAR